MADVKNLLKRYYSASLVNNWFKDKNPKYPDINTIEKIFFKAARDFKDNKVNLDDFSNICGQLYFGAYQKNGKHFPYDRYPYGGITLLVGDAVFHIKNIEDRLPPDHKAELLVIKKALEIFSKYGFGLQFAEKTIDIFSNPLPDKGVTLVLGPNLVLRVKKNASDTFFGELDLDLRVKKAL
ncbi:MAG: hypothetical protein M1312_01695, partial [Patescibacteria group bacterium]|nr:hypothetical protein [Patescibacteria group bacterium]